MEMIEVLKSILQPGMEISNIKEYASKTKFTLTYRGMSQDKCEILNTCTPGNEKDFCRSVINTIVSGMYINTGNLKEAEAWLHGERWNDTQDIQPVTNIRDKIIEYISELDIEIDRCTIWVEENMSGEACKVTAMESRIETLTEVKNDLQSRLDEVI